MVGSASVVLCLRWCRCGLSWAPFSLQCNRKPNLAYQANWSSGLKTHQCLLEDCLHISIWTPKARLAPQRQRELSPVLVWIGTSDLQKCHTLDACGPSGGAIHTERHGLIYVSIPTRDYISRLYHSSFFCLGGCRPHRRQPRRPRLWRRGAGGQEGYRANASCSA